MSKNEDITRALSVFNKDPGKWAGNLVRTGEFTRSGRPITVAEAKVKVSEVTRFLESVGGW